MKQLWLKTFLQPKGCRISTLGLKVFPAFWTLTGAFGGVILLSLRQMGLALGFARREMKLKHFLEEKLELQVRCCHESSPADFGQASCTETLSQIKRITLGSSPTPSTVQASVVGEKSVADAVWMY